MLRGALVSVTHAGGGARQALPVLETGFAKRHGCRQRMVMAAADRSNHNQTLGRLVCMYSLHRAGKAGKAGNTTCSFRNRACRA